MKKRIYIYENTNSLHIEEALVTLHKVFNQDYDVKFCLNNKAINRIQNNTEIIKNTIKIVTISDFISFIRNVKKDDIVIYPTISARNICILYLMSLLINQNIYYIRNSNSWLKYANHQNKVVFKLISNITTFFKKRLLRKAYQVFVANSNIKNYLELNNVKTLVNIVPYKFFDIENYHSSIYSDRLNIVIPGGIDISKKDLPLIRKATSNLSQNIKDKLSIILLGKPSREEDLKFCEEWKKEIGDSLKYFTSFIPDSEFTSTLTEAHFVLGILTINYEDKYNKEVYGVSKDTGVDAQAIAYGKPLIINQEFKVAKEIESSTLGFKNSDDLSKIIEELVLSDNYDKLSLLAKNNSQKISLANIVKNLKGL